MGHGLAAPAPPVPRPPLVSRHNGRTGCPGLGDFTAGPPIRQDRRLAAPVVRRSRRPRPSCGGCVPPPRRTAAQVELDLPSPPWAVPGQPGQLLPPCPPQNSAQPVGRTRTGQPRRPMQALCDEHRALACKSCKGHKGVRHCCSRHHQRPPRVLGVGSTVSAGSGEGGAAATWHYALQRAGASAGTLFRGRGRGSSRAGSSSAATRGHAGAATRPREGLRGGHTTRGGRPSAALDTPGGQGCDRAMPQAGSNPLTPNPPAARAARTLKAFNPRY